jgi:hypothetical protein
MEKKNAEDMEILNCCHHLCKLCLDKLIKNVCPFCRLPFDNVISCNILDNNDLAIDNIYPASLVNEINNNIIHSNRRYILRQENRRSKAKGFRSNKERDPYERKKKKWKKKNIN